MQVNVTQLVALLRSKGMNDAAAAIENSIEIAGDACRVLGFQDDAAGSSIARVNAAAAGSACAKAGKCGGTCDTCKTHNNLPSIFGDAWTQLVGMSQARGCGMACRPLSPCMIWALQMMLTRVSMRLLFEKLQKDDDSVEINTFCGGSDFVNITTTPLTNNKTTLLTMSSVQQLPLIAAISKASVQWVGDPVNSGVSLQLYQGPKGLTGLQLADLNNGPLVTVGTAKNLTRWFCGDDCFLRPWPPFLGCSGGIIPDTEAIYLQITTDNSLGGSTLKALPFEVLKAGTFNAGQYCGKCGVTMDDFGTPLMVPTQWM